MPILVAIVLGIVALIFVLYPLYRHSPAAVQTLQSTGEEATISTEQEQAARVALHEIELDYRLGNIAEADYSVLRERYMRRALVALKSRYDREQELDEEIEEQLRKLKEENEHVP